MHRFKRLWAVPVLAVAAVAVIGVGVVSARTAHSSGKTDKATVYASITHSTKSGYEYAAGDLADKVLGSGAITYKIKVTSNSGKITLNVPQIVLYASGGSLTGTGSATLNIGKSSETITNGKVDLTKGTGALKGHSFKGTFTGTGNLSSNQFVFNETGKYK